MTTQTIALIFIAVIGLLVALSYLVPRKTVVSRSAKIAASTDKVYALVASNTGYQRFNPYHDTDANLQIDLFGPAQGIGSGFAFKGKEGKGTQTITDVSTERAVTMQIDMGAMGKPVQHFELNPNTDGTEVTWSIEADSGYNPMMRVFGLLMDKFVGGNIERGLQNLAKASV